MIVHTNLVVVFHSSKLHSWFCRIVHKLLRDGRYDGFFVVCVELVIFGCIKLHFWRVLMNKVIFVQA